MLFGTQCTLFGVTNTDVYNFHGEIQHNSSIVTVTKESWNAADHAISVSNSVGTELNSFSHPQRSTASQ